MAGLGGFSDPSPLPPARFYPRAQARQPSRWTVRAAHRPGGHSPDLREPCEMSPFTDEKWRLRGGHSAPGHTARWRLSLQ